RNPGPVDVRLTSFATYVMDVRSRRFGNPRRDWCLGARSLSCSFSLALLMLPKVDANGYSDRAWLNQKEAVRDHVPIPARDNAAFVRKVVDVEIDRPSAKFRAGFQISLCVRGQILSLRAGNRKGVQAVSNVA